MDVSKCREPRDYYKQELLVDGCLTKVCIWNEYSRCKDDCRLCNIPVYSELRSIQRGLGFKFGYGFDLRGD